MRRILCILVLLIGFSACASGDVAQFDQRQDAEEDLAQEIARHLEGYRDIKNAVVRLDGGTAVVSLDLADKYSDGEIIALKQAIAAHVRGRYADVDHVVVSTAFDMFEDIKGNSDSAEERRIKRELASNEDEAIFAEILPGV